MVQKVYLGTIGDSWVTNHSSFYGFLISCGSTSYKSYYQCEMDEGQQSEAENDLEMSGNVR